MKRQSLTIIANEIIKAAGGLYNLSVALASLAEFQVQQGNELEPNMAMAAQRIEFASFKMKEAGELLLSSGTGPKKKIKGKGWIKGGL